MPGPEHQPAGPRRRARPALRALLLPLMLALGPAAQAQDDGDRALAGLRPAEAGALPRSLPLQPQDWARRLPAADRLSPPALRPVDAQLLQAAQDGRWPDALALLQAGDGGQRPDANASPAPPAPPAPRGSLLALAAAAGADEVARALVQRGADLQRSGADGFTPLGAAAYHGHLPMLRLLLRSGADPLRWGSSGQGPLHLAALAGRTDALALLLASGVPIDSLNSQRESALDVAAAAGQSAAMDRLIQGGADLTMAGRR